MTLTEIRQWTIDEYYRIADAGILNPNERVELLEGQIIKTSPQYPLHAATTQCAANYLRDLLGGLAYIRMQLPITIPPDSEPEPDLAIVRQNSSQYKDRHPAPDDVYLLIEVADATLRRDRRTKARIYATANISEYWVLDIIEKQVYIFRQPANGTYQKQTVFDSTASIVAIAFPKNTIVLDRLFP